MINNEIYLRRKGKVWIERHDSKRNSNAAYIGALLKNLESLGYCLSGELIEILYTFSGKELGIFLNNLISNLRKMLGASVSYHPMYPNFPEQVMELSDAELYLNALIHYLTDGKVLPYYEIQERETEILWQKQKVISYGTKEEFTQMMTDLILAKSSISETDQKDLEWYLLHEPNLLEQIPREIPFHEIKAFVCNVLLKRLKIAKQEEQERETALVSEILFCYLTTATDVLRLATVSSGGDSSLAVPVRFRQFNRKERRMLLFLLENCKNLTEDMKRYRERFIKLGERLHPGEYYNRYPKTENAFFKLRNGIKISTFAGKVEEYFTTYQLEPLLQFLKKRPGEFARRLDRLMRTFKKDQDIILKEFEVIADKIATPLLLQIRTHFLNRFKKDTMKERIFFPKGNLAKAHIEENVLPELEEESCRQIVQILEETLIKIYSKREPMGKVYVAPEFCDYLVPFSQRSSSRAFRTVVRGSKLPISEETDFLRVFLYWHDGTERTDIDLAAVVLNEEFIWMDHISYTNLKSQKMNACHSGDIVAAPKGASEFIDIGLQSAQKAGARYIVFTVNAYTQEPFCDLPECFMGYMERHSEWNEKYIGQRGKLYEPRTVKNKIDLTANTRICIPMTIDLLERKLVWMDMALKHMPSFNCVENNANNIIATCKALLHCERPNLKELLTLHIKARGEEVTEKTEADLCFDLEDGITPFDTEIFLSEYL